MDNKDKLLYTFSVGAEISSLEDLYRILEIKAEAISQDFGLILIDPLDFTYCILLNGDEIDKLISAKNIGSEYSNARIDVFILEEE